jgi:hypothetical protein
MAHARSIYMVDLANGLLTAFSVLEKEGTRGNGVDTPFSGMARLANYHSVYID